MRMITLQSRKLYYKPSKGIFDIRKAYISLRQQRMRSLNGRSLKCIASSEREVSYTVGGDVNWCSHYAKQYGGFSKNLKQNYNIIHNSTLGYIHAKNKTTNLKRYMNTNVYCVYVFICMHICMHNGILLSHEKEYNFVNCSNTNGLKWYYAKVK